MQKKRVIKQYENLTSELQELIKVKYPFGYKKALIKITTLDKKIAFAFPLETEDTYYLVRPPLPVISPIKVAPIINDDDDDYDDDDDDDDDDELDEIEEIEELPKTKKKILKGSKNLDDDDDDDDLDEIDDSDLDLDF